VASAVRPRIAIPARFADSTSATRYSGIVTARKLAELVWAAGGEPLTFLPVVGVPWSERLEGIGGVLLPGGGDVDPRLYGEAPQRSELYGIDPVQDQTDMELVRFSLESSIPLLTICRGTQLANVALGGSLIQHMQIPHINHRSNVEFKIVDPTLGNSSSMISVSCFHHQSIDRLGREITPLGFAQEGHVEAVRYPSRTWAFGLQWHPEDNYLEIADQLEIVKSFIKAARN